MRHFAALCLSVCFLLGAGPASAQAQWRDFRSDTYRFSVQMPGSPAVTERRIRDTESTQANFLIETGGHTYMVTVINLVGSAPPAGTEAYFQNLVAAYTGGSGTTLRTSRMTTWAGRQAMEAVTETTTDVHLVLLTVLGNRVYMLVFAGGKGEERGPNATRFRDSFRLLP